MPKIFNDKKMKYIIMGLCVVIASVISGVIIAIYEIIERNKK